MRLVSQLFVCGPSLEPTPLAQAKRNDTSIKWDFATALLTHILSPNVVKLQLEWL